MPGGLSGFVPNCPALIHRGGAGTALPDDSPEPTSPVCPSTTRSPTAATALSPAAASPTAATFTHCPGGSPQRPGLVREEEGGASIEVKVWSIPGAIYGIPAPLGIRTLRPEDGATARGFMGEPYAAALEGLHQPLLRQLLPSVNLRGVYPVLRAQLSHRLLALEGRQRHLRLELTAKLPSCHV